MNKNYRTQDEVCEKQFDLELAEDQTKTHPRAKKPVSAPKSKGVWNYFAMAGQLGFDIALPMVLGLIVGTKLDERWGTRPKATLALLAVGFVISCTSLIRIVRDASRKR